MRSTWVLIADEAKARFLELPDDGGDLREVDQMTHASAHADEAALRRDAYGRRGHDDLRMGGNATASAGPDPLEKEGELFARRVAERLAQAQQKQHYEALRVVAAPRFLGYLRQVLPKQVADTVVDELDKDLIHEDLRSLTRRLFPPGARPIDRPL